MGCNCGNTNPCNKCNNGQPCNCPPDYRVTAVSSSCKCCLSGYSYFGPTANYPNGYCQTDVAPFIISEPVACVDCETVLPTDCVVYTGDRPIDCGVAPTNIYGINAGDTLTTIISKMCISKKSVIQAILSEIGLDSDLGSAFCQLVQNCPPASSGTMPIISSITITFP